MASPLPPPSGPLPPWRRWLLVGAGWTVYGAVTAALFGITSTGPAGTRDWIVPLMLAVGAFWTLATPLVARLTRWLAPERVGRARSAAGHLAAGLALSVGCTVARWLVFRGLRDDAPELAPMIARLLDYHLCMYALVVVLTRAADSQRALVERTRRALALEARVARARLDFLQRQLQPHFLFNTLNVAAELTREAPRAAARMLRQLARLLAAATERLTDAEVSLAEELRLLDAYADVQRTRFGRALDVVYRVPPALGAARVPTLVLQPLLENAIRHGLSSGRGRVVVAAERRGDRLALTIEDSGTGGAEAGGRAGGIGLRNTRDRLAVLHGDGCALDLRRAPNGGTVAVLELPYATAGADGTELVHPLRGDDDAGDGRPREGGGPDAPHPSDDAVVTLARPAHALPPPQEPPDAAPPDAPPSVRAATILALWGAIALVWCAQVLLLGAVSRDGRSDAVAYMWANVVAAGTWAALTPVVLRLARAVRVTPERWAAPLAAHALLCAAVATGQIALAAVLIGDRPLPRVAGVVNPLTQSALVYLAIVGWSHAHDLARRHRARALAAERLAAELERTELRARAMELHPAFVVAVLERGAALVEDDAERVEEVLERLADLLRLILDEGELEGGGAPTLREELALLEESLDVLALVSDRAVALDEQLPAEALDARVIAGSLRRVLDRVLDHLPAGTGARLAVEVTADAAGEGGAWRVTARVAHRPRESAAHAAAHVA